jgi:DNA-binding FrmR family transcriptional regulator
MRGYQLQSDDYRVRLRRIEGQVRGLQRMVEEDEYCIDILTQIASVTRALQGVGLGLLDAHLRHCVSDATGPDEAARELRITEAVQAVERLLKA